MCTQSCVTLCNPMDCSPPGSSVHGIFQARILEWVAISSSRGIFPTQGLNLCLFIGRLILYYCTTWEAPPKPLLHKWSITFKIFESLYSLLVIYNIVHQL